MNSENSEQSKPVPLDCALGAQATMMTNAELAEAIAYATEKCEQPYVEATGQA